MLKSRPHSLQDTALSYLLDNGITTAIFLKNGVQLRGEIQAYDAYALLLIREDTSQQQLIFKHAISTIVPMQPTTITNGSLETSAANIN
jgi:host factor-I protein